MPTDDGQRSRLAPWWVGLVTATGHLLAIAVIAGLFVLWMTHAPARATIWRGLARGVLLESTLLRGGLHLALSATVWGAIYGVWHLVRSRNHGRLTAEGGAVMLETAIVLPVALTLIMGLAQLGIINIASTLTSFASYEAARAAWIWEGERDASRAGATITTSDVEEYARLQAAMVITPAAPGAYRQGWNLSDRARKTRGMLVGAQIPVPFADAGKQGMQLAQLEKAKARGDVPESGQTSFALGLDPGTNLRKTVGKFSWAYQATDVDLDAASDPGGEVTVELTYYHYCSFPLVRAIFGDRHSRGGRSGYFRKMTRTISRRRQRPATEQWPHWQSGDVDRSIQYL